MSTYETKQIFSENLCRLLSQSGKSQLDLALQLGVAPSSVSSWCNGEKMPRMDKVERMAQYFNVPVASLIEPITTSEGRNIIKIAGRDGSFRERSLTDDQMKALNAFIDLLPEVPDDL